MKSAPQIEKILTREEFRRSTMGCFYQDELRAHDRAMRKRLATALEEQRAEMVRKVEELDYFQDSALGWVVRKSYVLAILNGEEDK